MEKMLDQTFGMELEMSGITRIHGAEIIANYFGTEVLYEGTYYDTYYACDTYGRKWRCTYDSSIIAVDTQHKCEMVTPILKYEDDIEDLQALVRLFRAAGAVSSSKKQCGIHVHIGLGDHTIKTLKNLVNFMSAYQDVIYKALNIAPERWHWCKKLEPVLVDKFNERGLDTMEKGETAWYGKNNEYGKYQHYNPTRYHGLNLHSVFSKGTIEFRLFNGTLHAGKIRAYVLFCLAMSNYALEKKSIHRNHKNQFNDKYTMYALLCQMGFTGEKYQVIRKHLTDRLTGSLTHEGRYIK